MTGRSGSDGSYDDGTEGAHRLAQAGADIGRDVRAWLGEDVSIGSDVSIGAGARIVADRLVLGDGTRIEKEVDLRSSVVEVGSRCELLAGVSVLVADRFALGTASRIEGAVSITCRSFQAGKLFYFGHHSSVGYGGTTAATAHVRIGERVALGPHSILNANMPIELGDQVGSGCYLAVWTHGFHFGHRLTDGFDATFQGVRVGANVWLGFHVTLLPGVSIGPDTIVAGGALVARDLPASVLAGGVPAKPLKPLELRPVPEREMLRKVEALLDEWCTELTWKGTTCERRGRREVVVDATRVLVLGEGEEASTGGEDELVVLTLDGRPGLHSPNTVIFELRTGELHGNPSAVAHDLRDHLRRHALPCGDDQTFRSLASTPFARLMSAVPLRG